MVADIQSLAADKVAGIVVSPVDTAAIAPELQHAMEVGIYVSTVVASPATSSSTLRNT